MSNKTSIAVAGAGLIGKKHVEAIRAGSDSVLTAIIDPAESARDYASELGVPWFFDLKTCLEQAKPDGMVLATPNQTHVQGGLECIKAGVPVLVEKPIAADIVSAGRLVIAGEQAGVPILVGHHRRHNPLVERAHNLLRTDTENGGIGKIVAVQAMCWFYKPQDYFKTGWRSQPGAGPVFINLIHDIDLLRYFCGEIVHVRALQSNAIRENDIEETCVVVLRFESGALGTVSVSDTIVSPWSWELSAKENPAYHPAGQFSYLIGGTHGSLELPQNRLWRNPGVRSWRQPVLPQELPAEKQDLPAEKQDLPADQQDPLLRQIRHFCRVIKGQDPPLVSGREGLNTLGVIEAIKRSALAGGEGIDIKTKT